jgi:predicted enzyme related to lactoylglutathione lyase
MDMKRVTGIGGVFLRARDPVALAGWYREHLGLDIESWNGAVLRASGGDSTIWSVFPAETEYFGRPDQQAMVNYRVDDLDAIVAQLRAAGVAVDEPQDTENGRFAWASDPEGNRFELWQPPEGE